jgi:hypothetical protein
VRLEVGAQRILGAGLGDCSLADIARGSYEAR